MLVGCESWRRIDETNAKMEFTNKISVFPPPLCSSFFLSPEMANKTTTPTLIGSQADLESHVNKGGLV